MKFDPSVSENRENIDNSEQIYKILNQLYKSVNKLKIVDICCGVFDTNGVNYDLNGAIYQPIVAEYLGQKGLDITGIDFRQNQTDAVLHYNHRSDINILEANWTRELSTDFDSLIFLRSWDTPEILLHYQDLLQITDLNQLCLEIAKIYLPQFKNLIKRNGLFFTTDICNFGVCEDVQEIKDYQQQIDDLLAQNGLQEVYNVNGLYGYKKICK